MTAERIDWWGLVVETVQDPPRAAARIMSWHLPRSVLYQALLAMVAINVLIVGGRHYVTPNVEATNAGFDTPFVPFLILFGVLMVLIHLYYWAGRAIGGTGDLGGFLALFIWMQAISLLGVFLTQIGLLVLPALGLLIYLAVLIFNVWLTLHFFKSGLGLRSLWHSAALLIGVPLGVILGLSILIVMIGAADLGIPGNV